jgi:predicted nucleic acid-binding protein
MTGKRLKVFLDTNVLLAALQGRRSANALFKSESRRAASYVIDSVVLQELLLAAQETSGDLDKILKHVRVLDSEPLLSSEALAEDQVMRNRLVHTNDLLILGAARDCDILLTYDEDLLRLGDLVGVTTKTPEGFMAEIGDKS